MPTEDRRAPINPTDLVSLQVGGVEYRGWKSVRIRHSIEQLAGVFSLEIHDRWPGQSTEWTIDPGESCIVKIGQDTMITGYVDVCTTRLSPTEHTISIEGRDKAGDLVDCSAPPREWVGMSFEHVATELCKPYGIELFRQVLTGPAGYITPDKTKEPCPLEKCRDGGDKLPRKATNSGETVHKTLEKLAKIQGVLLISDRKGGLLVTRAGLGGRANDVLAMGQNLKSIEHERSFANLFSEITVKGQANGATSTAAGAQTLSGAQTVKPSATVVRSGASNSGSVLPQGQSSSSSTVGRYRPLIVVADSQADAKRCLERAQWEASTREAKSKRITVVVQGWRQQDGTLWSINTLVRLKCPWVREDEDMLITSCEYSLDASGTTTRMQLTSPDAYTVLREIPKPDGQSAGKQQRLSGAKPRGRQER